MNYSHRFEVRAPLAKVAEFHNRAASMVAITPPPIVVRIHRSQVILEEGGEMDFTMWLGPLPLRWLARIENVSTNGFTDRQLHGPFAEWVHRHTFIPMDDQTTVVIDEITMRLNTHPVWWLVGMGLRAGLPVLFAYRGWKTRSLLQ